MTRRADRLLRRNRVDSPTTAALLGRSWFAVSRTDDLSRYSRFKRYPVRSVEGEAGELGYRLMAGFDSANLDAYPS